MANEAQSIGAEGSTIALDTGTLTAELQRIACDNRSRMAEAGTIGRDVRRMDDSTI